MNPKWIVTARLFLGTKVPPHFFLTEMSDSFFLRQSRSFTEKSGFTQQRLRFFFYGKADIFYSKAEFFLQFFFIVISM